MKQLKFIEIAEAVNGEIICNDEKLYNECISGISTDSRSDLTDCLFIPLRGERFDGHDFIEEAIDNNAVCIISENNIDSKVPLIIVSSTFEAIKNLATYYRSLFDVKVIAVTGSVGKTTTKDLVASMLEQKHKVLKTMGNFNNEIGVPLTIFNLEEEHDYLVLEMGMNHKGEIHNLSNMGKPDIAIITNIGNSHIENLNNKEGIRDAKLEIIDFLAYDGHILLNGDDELLNIDINKINKHFFGLDKKNDIYAENIVYDDINSISCDINYKNTKIHLCIPSAGIHMVYNALCTALIGFLLNIDTEIIKQGIEVFKPTNMRMNIIKTEVITIINDVYNASPESMRSSIEVLSKANGNKVAILGDMLELGEHSQGLHKSLGEYISTKNIDLVVFIGEFSRITYEITKELSNIDKQVIYFKTKEEALVEFQKLIKINDTILIKASRGMKFENIVNYLRN